MPFEVGLGRVPGLRRAADVEPHVEHVGLGHHGEQDRVVVPVVRALHLHDRVPAGRGAGARGSRPSWPRCPSSRTASARAGTARRSLLGERDRGLGGDGEVRCPGRPRARIASTIFGCAWPHDVDAEAAVEVDVLVAVDVPDRRSPCPRRRYDRVGVAGLEVRRRRRSGGCDGPLVQASRTPGSGPGACAPRARRSRRPWPSDVRRRSRCTSRWMRQSTPAGPTEADVSVAACPGLGPEVHELQRDVEVVLPDRLHHDLEIVLGLAQ